MNAISLALQALQNATAITDLVSDRIYLIESDQSGVMPQIALSDVSDNPINALSGEATTINERIQIDVHSKSYAEAKNISDAIKTVMDAAGAFSSIRLSTQKVKDLDTNIHRWIIDFSIWYTTA